MTDKQGFVRLNREQKRVLRLIKPLDGVDGALANLFEDGVEGIPFRRLLPVLYELKNLGYITTLNDEHRQPWSFSLSSWAKCYRWEYFMNIVAPVLLQMLGGVSGGVAVWLLTKVFG